MSRFPQIAPLFAAAALCACATEQQQQRPAPRPQPAAASAGTIVERDPDAPITREQEEARMKAETGHLPAVPAAKPTPQPAKAQTIHLLPAQDHTAAAARFGEVYRQRQSPTVAVFFNRTLSDVVREWVEPRRTLTVTEVRERWRYNGDLAARESNTASIQTSPGTNPLTEERQRLDEKQAWIVEEAFQAPLLRQGTRLVDRATMMRLAAFKSGKQDNPDATLALKHLEMGALLGHADYFVELLVANRGDSKLGYELRAQVKEVKTGIIVASATTATWRFADLPTPKSTTRRVAVATETGYEYEDRTVTEPEPIIVMPTNVEVAERLAQQVMDQLTTSWARR